MASFLVALVLVVLFAFVDVWYFVRLIWVALKSILRGNVLIIRSEGDIFRPYVCYGVVLPFDLDCMLHMNNSKYLREMDFGRIGHAIETGIRRAVWGLGGTYVLSAAAVRYRRSLTLFQRFSLKTRILCWEDGAMYLEQTIVGSDGFLDTILFAKLAVRGTTVPIVMEKLIGRVVASPRPPPEIQSWIDSIQQSSEALKKKSGSQ